jgi:hypothetical protein
MAESGRMPVWSICLQMFAHAFRRLTYHPGRYAGNKMAGARRVLRQAPTRGSRTLAVSCAIEDRKPGEHNSYIASSGRSSNPIGNTKSSLYIDIHKDRHVQ